MNETRVLSFIKIFCCSLKHTHTHMHTYPYQHHGHYITLSLPLGGGCLGRAQIWAVMLCEYIPTRRRHLKSTSDSISISLHFWTFLDYTSHQPLQLIRPWACAPALCSFIQSFSSCFLVFFGQAFVLLMSSLLCVKIMFMSHMFARCFLCVFFCFVSFGFMNPPYLSWSCDQIVSCSTKFRLYIFYIFPAEVFL